jgi:hypothetical protein
MDVVCFADTVFSIWAWALIGFKSKPNPLTARPAAVAPVTWINCLRVKSMPFSSFLFRVYFEKV